MKPFIHLLAGYLRSNFHTWKWAIRASSRVVHKGAWTMVVTCVHDRHSTGAEPGITVGGANLRRGCFSAKMCEKMKEMGSVGGGGRGVPMVPPRSTIGQSMENFTHVCSLYGGLQSSTNYHLHLLLSTSNQAIVNSHLYCEIEQCVTCWYLSITS